MLVAEREDRLMAMDGRVRAEPKRTEIILSDAGLSVQQIAGFLGKKANTVQKTLSRTRDRSAAGGMTDDE